ncbi:MAG: hypothetical protein KDC87_04110 [Planctomycetes bacterium]|nr:hypothetical protein [Planctomycetota bacterium]
MKSHLSLASILAFGVLAQAQNPVAFPQDASSTTVGNSYPLGYTRFTTSSEARFQQLIPVQYLPGANTIVSGLSVFMTSGSSAINYQSLKITLGHTTASILSTTFSANLANATTVYNKAGTINFTTGSWTYIPFSTPFRYDGKSNLTVEFQKVLDSTSQTGSNAAHGTTASPVRQDLPSAIYAYGNLNSGASTSTTSTNTANAFAMRLWLFHPTLTVGSDRGGANNNVFALGGSVTITNYGASGDSFATALALGFAPPISMWNALLYLQPPLVPLGSGQIGASGNTQWMFTIPQNAALIGVFITLQSLNDSAGVLRLTNATDFLINS